LLDIRMPGMNGFEVLTEAKKLDHDLPIIMVTAFGDVQEAVKMLKAGAHDYLSKPFCAAEVLRSVHDALSGKPPARKPTRLDRGFQPPLSLLERMGSSAAIQSLATEVARVAPTDFSVLIIGETGVGKEVVAQAIHAQSPRSLHGFVAVDCGAVPETLIESEFFGHEKGAFTGADRTKAGKFETAAGGTLFLDEISNLPLAMQSTLLRVLQEKRFCRVGGSTAMKADVRIVAATNQDLSSVGPHVFRCDLYHRLSEYTIHIPPLRERTEDMPFLIRLFVHETNMELGKNVKGVCEEALRRLLDYGWPGNVRELRNIMRRAGG